MREILFRGKRIDNGEWIYGYYARKGADKESFRHYICVSTFSSDYQSNYTYPFYLYDYEVDPSTVGQYTGLTDKNGKKIFEGDIILRRYVRPYFLVEYSEEETEYQANFFDGSYASLYKYFSSKESKVIGNIHDNPELLEDKS